MDCFFSEIHDVEEDCITGCVDITFSFGNIERKHTLLMVWNEVDGLGLSNEEGEMYALTVKSLLMHLYFDLSLEGLNDEYLN